jgi:hypothetical protein
VFESAATTVAGGMVRAILVDPWARMARPVQVPTRALACGCLTADGLAMVDLLGRWQRAHPVLDSELLIVGTAVSAPSWTWGADLKCQGFGLILAWGHTLSDSRAALHEVEHYVEFPAAPGDGAGGLKESERCRNFPICPSGP